jgi:hypothetical protein
VRQQTEVAEGDVIGFGAADLQYLGPVEAPATPVEPLVVPEASAEAWVEPIAPVGPPVDAVSLLAPAEGVWGREPISAAAVSDVKPPPGETPLSEIDHATAATEQGGHGVSFDSTDLPGGAAAEPVRPTGEPALSGVVPSRAEPTKSSEPVPAVEAPIAARAAAPSTEAADEPRPAKPAVATGVGGLPALLEWRPEARPSFLESSHVSVHEPAGAGADDVPADEGTPGAVTVWGFDELARRVQADRAGPAPDNAGVPLSGWRRWRRVLLAAGLVCAVCGMLIAAMVLHKLL